MAHTPHCLARERTLRIVAVIAAICWIGVGSTSRNTFVDILPREAWLICTGLAAGSALALARWGSLHALQSYTIIAVSIGVLRSVAYALEDVWGPLWVWGVLVSSTVAFYVAFAPHLAEHQRGRLAEEQGV